MRSEEVGFVYRWTNRINGKWYIGSHLGNPDDGYVASGALFHKALKKYGIESFDREILYTGVNFREEETSHLRQNGAAGDPMSYNLKDFAFGGAFYGEANGMFGKKMTEEHKRKIFPKWTKDRKEKHSKRMSGANNPLFGRGHSQFTVDKIKETKRRSKEDWGFLGNGLTHGSIFRKIYRRLLVSGSSVSPRGQQVIESENFNYVLPPFVRFVNFESRKLNLDYIKREFLWYLRGDPEDLSIVKHAKLWKGAVTKLGTINSNYGQYIFRRLIGEDGQYDYIVETLKKDKDSRRAAMMILGERHIRSGDSDLPCTYSLSFRIRKEKLNMTVRMRSQDAIFGMGSDAPCFSIIHEMMLNSLREVYPNLQYGDYYHSADSFHVYERHYEMINKIVSTGNNFSLVRCPKISGKNEVDFLRIGKFDSIPEGYRFTKWLNSFEV